MIELPRVLAVSLRSKVVLAAIAATLVLAAVSLEAYRAFGYARASAAWVGHTHTTIEALNEVQSDLTDAETSERGYLLTLAPRFLAPYDSNVAEIHAHLVDLQRLTADSPAQLARTDTLGRAAAMRVAQLQAAIDFAKQGRLDSAIAIVRNGRGSAYMDTVRSVVTRMSDSERRLLAIRQNTAREQEDYSLIVSGAAFILAIVIAVGALVAIVHDISARERVAAELADTASRAQEANRAKSEFLARMSHELRTPLNSVIGFSNVLLKNKHGILREQELSFVERIRSNGTHLLGIINDILDLSKVESGRMDLHLAPVDVNALVRETVAQFAGRDHVPVEAELPPGGQPLECDRDKLKQVLLNLVANAAKFTEHGQILVRVVVDADTNRTRRIDVSDTGAGIPADRLSAIFEAFEQAESTTTRRYGGTGLGLTIARSICERMGFRLEVASTVGEGSTFSILCSPDEPSAPAHVSPTRGHAQDQAVTAAPVLESLSDAVASTVLVIDDSADSRLLLSQFLEDDGTHVITAVSGEQGVQLARELHPHLIILDLLMPGTDGWETLRRLKADPATQEIPVVVVSIVASEQRGGIFGAVDLVDKPVGREELIATVRRNIAGTPARVLVVEDNPDTRVVFAGFLADMRGVEIRMAATGHAAMAELEVFAPHVIILDLTLPDMDGLAVLRAVRRHPVLHAIPVIVATARDLSADERRELEAQAQAILAKDATIGDELRSRLRATLPQLAVVHEER